ncbi:hypothetical protein SELMODRAFT_444270 [Selaginella moellendorffii]|uniref:Uncharacterized protein n=1 Tax=Selaginella moellendorffii TaxID=88036 RepID=D8S8J5_SELML|nr:hypothetical protein SELMODRAFT_444270 [Selaginella moellendorffii]
MARGWGRGGDRGEDAEDHDEFDPEPYVGGYDIGSVYGAIKEASEEWSYPRSGDPGEYGDEDFEVDVGRATDYGTAKPSYYGHGQGKSSYGGHSSGYDGSGYGGGSEYGSGNVGYGGGQGESEGYGGGNYGAEDKSEGYTGYGGRRNYGED